MFGLVAKRQAATNGARPAQQVADAIGTHVPTRYRAFGPAHIIPSPEVDGSVWSTNSSVRPVGRRTNPGRPGVRLPDAGTGDVDAREYVAVPRPRFEYRARIERPDNGQSMFTRGDRFARRRDSSRGEERAPDIPYR